MSIPEDPILLATSCPLPPFASPKAKKQAALPLSKETIESNLDNLQVAPYQAMPVCGHTSAPQSRAFAQPIVEPDTETTDEERQAAIDKVLSDYVEKLEDRTRHHMGYPYNLDFDFGALEGLNKFCLNNLGDPFIESNYGVHSREFEVGVLNWFARLWQIEEQDYWGYITNCGTEGNLHGILVGRENLPDGVLYASKESHYSVFKAARMYRMDAVKVDTYDSGEINYKHLRSSLLANKGRPAVLNVNIGTTVKGAVDDVDKVLEVLKECGFSEDRFFIHCDGALFGMMMPFLDREAPMVTFQKPIGSISVSGHKFIGAPLPCGVVMTRYKYVMALSTDVEYLNSRDATIMGSRNGHAPIYLWYSLTKKGYLGMRRDVEKCMVHAQELVHMLEREGIKTMLNPLSNTVVFERPVSTAFVRKWQLACEGDIAHVVVMPNIGRQQLEDFVADYVRQRDQAAAGAAVAAAGAPGAAAGAPGAAAGAAGAAVGAPGAAAGAPGAAAGAAANGGQSDITANGHSNGHAATSTNGAAAVAAAAPSSGAGVTASSNGHAAVGNGVGANGVGMKVANGKGAVSSNGEVDTGKGLAKDQVKGF